MHEAQLNNNNIFITLTYNKESLPQPPTLKIKDFQKFIKRLRQNIKRKPDKFIQGEGKIKYLHCGEYGELCLFCGEVQKKCWCDYYYPSLGRPHYHAIVFNLDVKDKELISDKNGNKLYKSKTIEEIWKNGFCTIGSVTFESAAYVARYVTKKINGIDAETHYQGKKPEYLTMSRNPGIGFGWMKKWKDDVYPDDFVVIRGKKMKTPAYYDRQLEKDHKEEFLKLKQERESKKDLGKEDQTHERLMVRQLVTKSRMKQLTRTYETET